MEETNEVVELTYVPRYVKQIADYEYGDTLTHEAYNQLINVNSTQGDYNTEVLNILFNSEDEVYKIKYVDKKFTEIDEHTVEVDTSIANILETIDSIGDALDTIDQTFADIEDGTQVVGHAVVADELNGLVASGPNRYFGTDENTNVGFYPVPDSIYYEDINTAVGIDVINIVPAPLSVTEGMLTQDVQTKLNRQAGVTDYDYLTSRPRINNVLLTGNVSIADLGIQEAGDFVTNTSLTNTLLDYVTNTSLNTTLGAYATSADVSNSINDLNTAIAARARVGVNAYPTNPVTGDLYITV